MKKIKKRVPCSTSTRQKRAFGLEEGRNEDFFLKVVNSLAFTPVTGFLITAFAFDKSEDLAMKDCLRCGSEKNLKESASS